jgi:hypothetical protein
MQVGARLKLSDAIVRLGDLGQESRNPDKQFFSLAVLSICAVTAVFDKGIVLRSKSQGLVAKVVSQGRFVRQLPANFRQIGKNHHFSFIRRHLASPCASAPGVLYENSNARENEDHNHDEHDHDQRFHAGLEIIWLSRSAELTELTA